ncbi:MraY family glycosyltransferase [Polaribacter septentrionalilitoris]|uniref:MraY family glycosyltransferase n=1 Tax=Polaribacter septentrionalilitoris TaxID=2494657 RepID=UPI00135A1C1D|nr:glycosyltransferase family 4 protein [Polaribacter septentrionalilitoris]
MKEYLLVLVILIISSIVYLKLAVKYKIIDKPNQRSSHTKLTVRGGGIVFSIAIFLFFVLNDFQYPFFTIGVFILSIVSFLDDIYSLSSKLRFSIQFVGILLLLYQIGLPFFPVYMYLLFLFVGLGFLNSYNFMDGINAITGFYCISSLSILYLINQQEQVFHQDLTRYVFLSVIVFGFYNFRKKALFFAGDIGSIVLGFLTLFLVFKSIVDLNAPLMMLSVFIYGADAGYTMLYRKFFTDEKWTDPHRHHIYQKLVDVKKMSHLKIAALYAIAQLILNVLLFFSYKLPYSTQWMLLISSSVIFMGVYYVLFQRLKKIT